MTREQWAKQLNATWHAAKDSMLEAIFALGRDLLAARHGPDKLPHGEFQAMVREDLEFTPRTAQMLMKVASDQRLTKAKHASLLPPNWYALYLLSRLDDETFGRLVNDGTVCPDMERNAVSKVLRLAKVSEDERHVLSLVPVVGKFRTLVLDPAWEYTGDLVGRAKPSYALQSAEQLGDLNLKQWAADDCHLYCWVTNNFMGVACKLIENWGFQHRTILTWVKSAPFGLGSYFRNSTEHVLFATLGATTTRPAAASIPTHFEASRGEHSEKPEKFYDIVRAASYPPYGEGNQRTPRPDFTNLFVEVRAEAAE